ncbi:NHL repeat protein [compost metagenome]
MQTFTKSYIILLAFFLLSNAAYSQWVNGQAADMVFGHADFNTSTTTPSGLNTMNNVIGLAVDKNTKKVFVSDRGGNRVLRFANYETYTNGDAAEMALTNISGFTFGPIGIFIENNNLWIADGPNHRVLRIPNANTMVNGASNDLVLGQSFLANNNTSGTASDKFNNPHGIFVKDNTLWVSHSAGHKISRFSLQNISSGASAIAYLGSGTAGVSASILNNPTQIYVDENDNLWVSDRMNNRVLKFENAKSFSSGSSAVFVLGQQDFNTGSRAAVTSNTSFNSPLGIAGDAEGNLYVGENSGHRILIFKNAENLTINGAPADFVLGQPDFTSSNSWNIFGVHGAGFSNPSHLFIDKHLWVSDGSGNRVLRFSAPYPLPVKLTAFTAKTVGGTVQLNWETTSETNNSHFVIQKSVNGSTWTDVAKVASKAEKGNSSVPLNYTLSLPLGELALAGFGLLGLLLLPATRNRYLRFAVVLLVIGSIAGCAKTDDTTNQLGEDLKSGQAVYVRISQVDLDGTTTYSDAIAVKK